MAFLFAVPILAQSYHINCGGGVSGTYGADQFFVGGQNYVSPIALPAGAPAYLTDERYPAAGQLSFGYQFPVADGQYTVVLHFIENSTAITGPGQRSFNVAINGQQVIANLDLAAVAPLNTPIDKTFTVTATGASGISMVFTTVVRNAVVSAIDITPVAAPLIPCAIKNQRTLSCSGPVEFGAGSTYAPGITLNGVTYLFPVPDGTDTTGKLLKDFGKVSCANVDPEAHATECHQIVWQ